MSGASNRAIESSTDGAVQLGSGYVLDNMEGAVDRAAFLAHTDMPIAIVGARGTGKMYVARVVHEESAGDGGALVAVDCRTFRNRDAANRVITAALRDSRGKTLVFKYPHLMCVDAQLRLARQIASRTLLDTRPPRTLSQVKFVALLPDTIERLVDKQQLTERLGSVFAGYPIYVPPIRDRERAVLRWADKILLQECEDRHLDLRKFTPEAERAMLAHSWDGNISEIRQRIVNALQTSAAEWLGPAELGLLGALHRRPFPLNQPLLDGFGAELSAAGHYRPSPAQELEQRMAEAVHHVLGVGGEQPLGTWLEDEVVLAMLGRCGGQPARAAKLLQTTSRNIQRWLPRIEARTEERAASMYWKTVGEVVRRWLESPEDPPEDPLQSAREIVLHQLEIQGMQASLKVRAAVMGVSVPTYSKRLKLSARETESLS